MSLHPGQEETIVTPDACSDTGVLLRATGLSKSFGATQAIVSATLELLAGEAHAIVGENGSGKSTLVKILAGVHRPDAGRLEVMGVQRAALANPQEALQAGIATVFQEVLVVEPRSVLENIWLGHEGFLRAGLSDAVRRDSASRAVRSLLGRDLELDLPVGALSLSDRQACCLVRALIGDPRVIVLDEATSALDVATRERLFVVLRQRVAAGGGVIFISHRMDEVQELGDRITVMRSGETVATLTRDKADVEALVRLMTGGRNLTGSHTRRPAVSRAGGPPIIRTRDLRLAPGREPINVDFRGGELVGLAGLEGHGQDAFLRALAWGGHAGAVECDGQPLGSIRDAAAAGIAYVPRERRAESLFESKSILENFALPSLARDTRAGILDTRRSRARFAGLAQRLRIVLGDPGDPITSLSGGNQQKVVMARWLALAPRVLLLNDPTRGIDLGAKRDVYLLLRELADTGVSIVMLSTEVDEHIELMDRVLVFREYSLSAELSTGALDRQTLIAAFFGGIDR